MCECMSWQEYSQTDENAMYDLMRDEEYLQRRYDEMHEDERLQRLYENY